MRMFGEKKNQVGAAELPVGKMSVLYSLFVHRADAGRYLQRAEAFVFARHRRALRGVARDVVLSEAAEKLDGRHDLGA